MSPLPPDYEHKVYAGWLGKCIGVRFGAGLALVEIPVVIAAVVLIARSIGQNP